MTPKLVYRQNDNVLEFQNLRNSTADAGTYLNAATVTCTIKDLNGVEVVGEVWPLTLAYVAGSNGKYRATLEAALELDEIDNAVGYVDIVSGTLEAHVELPLEIQTRTSL